MTPEEITEVNKKQILYLQMLISAAKQRGDIKTVAGLENELITANNATNTTTK